MPRTPLTGPFRSPMMWQEMSVIRNQTPAPGKPQPRHPWEDWLLMSIALASVWYGLCELIQLMME